MPIFLKKDSSWVGATSCYIKQNGTWNVVNETTLSNYMNERVVVYEGEAPETVYVTNLLPQYTYDNWDFTNFNGGNYAYPASAYSGESVRPSGNVVVLFTNGNYGEAYIAPKQAYYPPLILGHQYYIRWMSRKELITNAAGGTITQDNSGVSEDVYWPEMEIALVRGINNSNYHYWRLNSFLFTATSSQWPSQSVTNGNYKIRFDCNNNRKYVKYWCTADFMMIDLTADYTNNGLTVPTLSELNAKSYFYGSMDITQW